MTLQLPSDAPVLVPGGNPTMVSTGLNFAGTAALMFVADSPPFELVSIKFLAAYARTTPQPAFLLDYRGSIAPNQIGLNYTNQFSVGDVTKVYRNEAAALVKAGIAAYY